MIIGIPRERKNLERRVALTPQGARELVDGKQAVLVEMNAGLGSGFEDAEYQSAGATIVHTIEEVWGRAQLLVKVKEPDASEYALMREDLVLFDYLHLASMPELARAMLKSKITSFAYELVQTEQGRLPLLEPMSEVAGKLSVINGAHLLLAQTGGRGLLISGASGVDPATVLVIGAGVAGRAAAKVALGMGARVTILDLDQKRVDAACRECGDALRGLISSPDVIRQELKTTDLLVGAVLVPGASAPRIISRDMLRLMRKNSVFVDISIDQGGCAETSRPTTLAEPTYVEEGVVHYGVCNMPAQVPCTSTAALTAATLPYIMELATQGVEKIMQTRGSLARAIVTQQGALKNAAIEASLKAQK